ncbi:MAG: hypothetical protein KBS65_02725 [Prevotella sp.]|nr:hypothetical protein [Candidatus Equicola stercoris]
MVRYQRCEERGMLSSSALQSLPPLKKMQCMVFRPVISLYVPVKVYLRSTLEQTMLLTSDLHISLV